MVCKTPVRNCSLFSMAGCSSFVKNRSKASLGFSNAGRLARLNWAYDTHDHPPCSELAPASGMRSAKRMRFPKGSRMKNSLRPHGLASSADCTALVVKYCCCKTSTSLVSPGNEQRDGIHWERSVRSLVRQCALCADLSRLTCLMNDIHRSGSPRRREGRATATVHYGTISASADSFEARRCCSSWSDHGVHLGFEPNI